VKSLLTSACLLGYLSLSSPVVAGTSADFLLHLCDSDDERSLFACSAYISGATEMFAVYQRDAGASDAGDYCPPEKLGSDEVETIWREELSAMPAILKSDAALTLFLSLARAYPCPEAPER